MTFFLFDEVNFLWALLAPMLGASGLLLIHGRLNMAARVSDAKLSPLDCCIWPGELAHVSGAFYLRYCHGISL